MRNNIIQKLSIAAVSTTLSCGLLEANPAQAALITYNFEVFEIDSRGSFRYDDTTGNTSIVQNFFGTVFELTSYPVADIEFLFNDQTYTEADALNNIRFSTLVTLDGDDRGMSLFWETEDFSFVPGSNTVFGAIFTLFRDNNGEFVSSVGFERVEEEPPISVPEPATLTGLAMFGLAGLLLKKKVSAWVIRSSHLNEYP